MTKVIKECKERFVAQQQAVAKSGTAGCRFSVLGPADFETAGSAGSSNPSSRENRSLSFHGEHTRHSAPYPQREEHAADHQGHEDGLGGQAAPRPGTCFGRASLRADDDQRSAVARHARLKSTIPKPASPSIRLLAQRPEQNMLLMLVTGDKGLAGAFNSNVLKAAARFLESERQEHRDRGHRPQGPRLPPPPLSDRPAPNFRVERAGTDQMIGEHIGVLGKLEYDAVGEMADRVIERYCQRGDRFRVPDVQRIQVGDLAAPGGRADLAGGANRARREWRRPKR